MLKVTQLKDKERTRAQQELLPNENQYRFVLVRIGLIFLSVFGQCTHIQNICQVMLPIRKGLNVLVQQQRAS